MAKPQNVELKRGSSVILEALADSANPVTYEWYKDGQPLQYDSMKSIVGLGNLKILGAQESDAGSYRVVATSGGQTLEATSEVTVISKLFGFSRQRLRRNVRLQ